MRTWYIQKSIDTKANKRILTSNLYLNYLCNKLVTTSSLFSTAKPLIKTGVK